MAAYFAAHNVESTTDSMPYIVAMVGFDWNVIPGFDY
jgi:hypothetical protein